MFISKQGQEEKNAPKVVKFLVDRKGPSCLLACMHLFGFYHVATLASCSSCISELRIYERSASKIAFIAMLLARWRAHFFLSYLSAALFSKVPYNSICPFLQLCSPAPFLLDFFFCVIFHYNKRTLN